MALGRNLKAGLSGDLKGKWEGHQKTLKGLKPEAPKPTEAEVALESRQREELSKLDDEENVRIKRGTRGRLGTRMLASRRASPRSSMLGGGASTSAGGSSGGEGYSGRTGRGMA